MSIYAIVATGSKQYKVQPKTVLDVELLDLPEGNKEVTLDQVLLARDGERLEIGAPVVKGAKVICDFLGEVKGKKTITFKYRRRKASRNKKGHRQQFSRLQVKEIKF